MERLTGKVAAITGGASGIGAGTVRRFVAEGAKVLIADLDQARGAALASELGAAAAFLRTDVSKEEDIAAMVAETTDRFGRIDVLFNNAGFGGALGPIESTTVADYDLTMDVLLKSVFLGMKHVAPLMKAQGSGSIISTASVAGIRAGYAPHLYSVAKSAVIHLTRTVALELGEHGVRVNAICPGFIATPLAAGRPDADESQIDQMRGGRRCLTGARPGGRGRRHRQHGAVPRQRRVGVDHRPRVRRRRRLRSRTTLVALARLHPHGAPDPPSPPTRPLTIADIHAVHVEGSPSAPAIGHMSAAETAAS